MKGTCIQPLTLGRQLVHIRVAQGCLAGAGHVRDLEQEARPHLWQALQVQGLIAAIMEKANLI
jgi:hypothetical protein